MRNRRPTILAAVAIVLAASATVPAADPAADEETKASVPALTAFHDVVFPLWHDGWQNRDLTLIAEMLPRVKEGVRAVRSADLPGILRDRREDWDAGVSALAEALAAYEGAVEAREEKGMLDAVEALHAGFEKLVRLVRPAMRELDAYHVELYAVYHKILPAGETGRLPAAAEAMADRCRALAAAEVPRRFVAKEAEIRREIEALCRDTDALREAAGGGDAAAVGAAVERVHDRYRKLEAAFR